MSFYDLSKEQRSNLVDEILKTIFSEIQQNSLIKIADYFSDEDTYIRKSAYQSFGKIYHDNQKIQKKIISYLDKLITGKDFKIRQTVINAAGELGIKDFPAVEHLFDKGLFDANSSVRNAVIGSIKKMGARNPRDVLKWAKKYLHHPDKEVRREICHGIELRGRTHPQDILPMLKELQHEKTARVRNTLVHVIGQISYKKGCLATVIEHLNSWDNKELTDKAVEEVIDVHLRYIDFAVLTQKEVIDYISKHYKSKT
ncbi:MAG: HEAT repeat domain-containing protein [Chitinophagales bacterium]|nr:HEAT repeat domain-containing protein [Chitinophagales bacterium]